MSEQVHRFRIVALVVLPLLGVIAAMVLLWERYVFPMDIALFAIFYPLTAMGITIGFHRMLTHQGFEAPEWLRGLILICGCMAFEGTPNEWTATHIKHHAHSDDEGDPHSPLEGFWYAHIGWLFAESNFADVQRYAPHLLEDRTVQFVQRFVPLWMGLSLAIPAIVGGWTGFVWGGLVRIFVVNHVTWSVNSVCHTFGRRPFETTDESRNEWLIGLFAFGEGWHNNHHAFPRNAFHGMRWWQFDLSGLIIRGLEMCGLAKNVQRVSSSVEEAKLQKAESVRQTLTELKEQLIAQAIQSKCELSIFFAKLPERERRMLRSVHDDAIRKLDEVRQKVAAMHHLRKARFDAFREEITKHIALAKDRMQKETKVTVRA